MNMLLVRRLMGGGGEQPVLVVGKGEDKIKKGEQNLC
jgi:hypothetical protein